ncbi:aspartate aminotransferase, cytoplasmic isoform X3 [Exaiptasia diaphana]|nr:aspartate aminotransferase, cytoplasmic isoform X3 [Exaiptasia diaphana]XP_028514715.1 aspartate aminotransferase, cytoplasmic isoform X3 [Exaiptasia diaphana]KXJ14640.1 Aspartate aminotransferase, cytoplasmic [Exaiptasia diaphana]
MAFSNLFKDVPQVPTDHVFEVNARFLNDTSPNKVNMGIGAYRTDEGKPWVLPVVDKVELQMAQDKTLNHEYLGIDGMRAFTDAACKLLLGGDSPAITDNRVCGIQSIGGTSSLRLALDFLYKFYPSKTVYISKPTWGNHIKICKASGYTDIREYNYYDADNKCVKFGQLLDDFEAAPEGSVMFLHACAHNPTGYDLNNEQWEKVAEVMKRRHLFPLFDIAYQGFASGNVEEDAWAVRYFVKQGFELLAGQSFSKNFGLYNERVGNLCVVAVDNNTTERIRSQLKAIVRPMFSNPPNHGARIVATVLKNPALFQEWLENVKTMGDRIIEMRNLLLSKLKELGTPGTWNHIADQKGMFSFTGLNIKQVEMLTNKHHIYLLNSGRINICGLTPSNIDYVAAAIHDVVCNAPK